MNKAKSIVVLFLILVLFCSCQKAKEPTESNVVVEVPDIVYLGTGGIKTNEYSHVFAQTKNNGKVSRMIKAKIIYYDKNNAKLFESESLGKTVEPEGYYYSSEFTIRYRGINDYNKVDHYEIRIVEATEKECKDLDELNEVTKQYNNFK